MKKQKEHKPRVLSDDFIDDLKSGVLNPLLKRIKADDTLMLAIRSNYINVYYRGGNLLKIKELSKNKYSAEFDAKYNRVGHKLPSFPISLKSEKDACELLIHIPSLKEVMDLFFTEKPKLEREFQQLVARENNYSSISNETEYFVVDIEYADSELRARFDILAVRWLRTDRNKEGVLLPVLVEMKYATGAFEGKSSISKHLCDLDKLIVSKEKWPAFLDSMEKQLEQLNELGLLKFNRSSRVNRLLIDRVRPPEVVMLLANVNPASSKLQTVLSGIPAENPNFNLRFFSSSFAGYAMHQANMLELEEMKSAVAHLLSHANKRHLLLMPDHSARI